MTKHDYIIKIAEVVRSKSDCTKRQVGAVFVNEDFEILATGYNAPPKGFPHCDRSPDPDVICGHSCGIPCNRTIHAEQNAICQAAKRGTALKDSTLYCTYAPCLICARMLINIGIKKVVVLEEDKNVEGVYALAQAKIDIIFDRRRI